MAAAITQGNSNDTFAKMQASAYYGLPRCILCLLYASRMTAATLSLLTLGDVKENNIYQTLGLDITGESPQSI